MISGGEMMVRTNEKEEKGLTYTGGKEKVARLGLGDPP